MLQLTLRVGRVGEDVTVTAATGINTSPAVTTTVDRRIIENAPLNGRTLQNLIALTPGVVLTGSAGQFSVNGQRANANYFTVDGVSANVGATPSNTQPGQAGGGSIPGFAVTGGTNNLVSIDALEEFKIQTSTYAPEFGRSPGAQVSTITRSGTNQFHGTAFEYLRNEKMDANDWFSNSRGLRKAELRQHDFGGVLGGPVLRNRTFFFLSSENLLMKLPQTMIVQVPSLALRERAASSIRPLLDTFPIPNGRDLGNGFAELAVNYSDPTRLYATSVRIDDHLSQGLVLFGRYNESPSFTKQRLFSLNDVRTTRTDTRTATIGATYTPSARVVNELRANYSRVGAIRSDALDDFQGARPPDTRVLFPSFAGPDSA